MIDPGWSETAAAADFNNDGKLDILSAEAWYQAPAWTRRQIRDINFTAGSPNCGGAANPWVGRPLAQTACGGRVRVHVCHRHQ
jgi:hypothetical protein